MTEGETGIPPTEQGEAPPKIEEHERFGAKVSEIVTGKGVPTIVGPRGEIVFGGGVEVEDLIYETEDGKKLSFKSLFPDNWKIVRTTTGSMRASYDFKQVFYRDKLVDEKGFFLGLLHEIGHAQEVSTLTNEEARARAEVQKRMLDPETPGKEKERATQAVVNNERDAWAWALRKFRELRRKGVDLEPELKTRQDLLRGINKCLKTHENLADPKLPKLITSFSQIWQETEKMELAEL